MPPTVPINHYFGPKNQSENKTQVLFYYPMLTYSGRVLACFEHSNLFKVNEPELRPRREIVEGRVSSPFEKRDEPFFREEGAVSLDTPRSETLGVPRRARVAPPPFRGSRRILPLSQEQERASGRRERANQCSPVGGGPASLEPEDGRVLKPFRLSDPAPKFNYELFNCNNFNIRYWSWNYRGCWHQTCPPIVPR